MTLHEIWDRQRRWWVGGYGVAWGVLRLFDGHWWGAPILAAGIGMTIDAFRRMLHEEVLP